MTRDDVSLLAVRLLALYVIADGISVLPEITALPRIGHGEYEVTGQVWIAYRLAVILPVCLGIAALVFSRPLARVLTPRRAEETGAPDAGIPDVQSAAIGTFGLLLLAAPKLAGRRTQEALVAGGIIGVVAALVLSIALGLWTLRTLREARGSSFLGPVAFGFLAKLVILGAGAGLLYGPWKSFGSFEAYAMCFVASVFGYQLLFLPTLGRAVKRERERETETDAECV